jgi:1-acyl-sn-glycerol-3-phosphate acyltransferase
MANEPNGSPPSAPPDDDDDDAAVDVRASKDDDDWYGESDPNVPDAAPWPGLEGAHDGDDVYLGGEATVPAELGGSYVSSQMPILDGNSAEQRELERRLDAHRTPAFPIDLRRRLPLEALWRRWRTVAMWGRSDVVDDFGRDPRATARWEWLFEFLYTRWFRVEASGLEHIPRTGRALLVANHAGSLPYDSAMVMHAVRRDHPTRRDVRPLVEDAVFHLPFLGPIMNRIGGVRADPENAERLLAKGELVAVFPEGEKGMGKLWRDRYRLQRFGRGGFVKLALRTGAPIIPVAVVGAEEAAPMLGKVTWFARNIGIPWIPVTPTFPWLGPAGLLPLPSKWFVQFGEPIDLGAAHDPSAAEDRLLVNRIADQIRTQIQQMVEGLLGRRRSPILSAYLG